ncbi:MAG: hypothetical protein JWQ01_4577 [Massilia sp.]|nr:hypothetical protein [Massilia sp.]
MLSQDRLLRFSRLERDGEQLRARFAALTSAHRYFQGPAALRSVSVSDPREDGSIEAVFMGVRVRFRMVFIFSDDFDARGRVMCTHCHGAYGYPVEESIGAFTFDTEGITDLESGIDGRVVALHADAPQIVLAFLERAIAASRCL